MVSQNNYKLQKCLDDQLNLRRHTDEVQRMDWCQCCREQLAMIYIGSISVWICAFRDYQSWCDCMEWPSSHCSLPSRHQLIVSRNISHYFQRWTEADKHCCSDRHVSYFSVIVVHKAITAAIESSQNFSLSNDYVIALYYVLKSISRHQWFCEL